MNTTTPTATPFGTVTVTEHNAYVEATDAQLRDWATRPGAAWPCSVLRDLEAIRVGFDDNGLMDLEAGQDDDVLIDQLEGSELNAWSSDVLRDVLPKDHPAYFVAVGQFEG